MENKGEDFKGRKKFVRIILHIAYRKKKKRRKVERLRTVKSAKKILSCPESSVKRWWQYQRG